MIWLKSKSDEEKGKLIAKASKDVKTVRKKFKSRLTEIMSSIFTDLSSSKCHTGQVKSLLISPSAFTPAKYS
jgi:hypothetical protein